MKHFLNTLLLIVFFTNVYGQIRPDSTVNITGSSNTNGAQSTCGSDATYELFAGQHILIGEVLIEQLDVNSIQVTYNLNSPWKLQKVHMHVGGSFSDFPTNKNGGPKNGKFEHQMSFNPKASTYSYTFDVSGLDTAYVATHAEVVGYSSETAWAGDQPFGTGWGSYMKFCVSSNPLPVEFLYFMVNHDKLEWKTAMELNNYGFWVQWSENGVDWIDKSFITGQGTTNLETSYNWEWDNSGYYRLLQTDFDGTVSYSNVVHVSIKNNIDDKIVYEIRNNTVYANEPVQVFDLMGNKVEYLIKNQVYILAFESQSIKVFY